jgi:hypothetical protein
VHKSTNLAKLEANNSICLSVLILGDNILSHALEIEHLVEGQIYVVSGSAPNDGGIARVVSLMVDPPRS